MNSPARLAALSLAIALTVAACKPAGDAQAPAAEPSPEPAEAEATDVADSEPAPAADENVDLEFDATLLDIDLSALPDEGARMVVADDPADAPAADERPA